MRSRYRAALFASLGFAWSGAASASAIELCDQSSGPQAVTYPSSADLRTASDRINGKVGEARASGVAVANSDSLFSIPANAEPKPEAEAIAGFCLAAGELSLVAEGGSQDQAQTFLLAALQYSEQAQLPALTARIAYRLGLLSTGGVTLRSVRGAGSLKRAKDNLSRQLRAAAAAEPRWPGRRPMPSAQPSRTARRCKM